MNKGRDHGFRLFVAIAGLVWGAAGCGEATEGEATEDDPTVEEVSAATSTLTLTCPTSLTANWIQAANGRTNTVNLRTVPFPPGKPASTKLGCAIENPGTIKLVQDVKFAPRTVPSACAAKVTFTGQGIQKVGVNPFGGWPFKSERFPAVATYNESTGACHLEFRLAPTIVYLKTSQPCKDISATSFSCPDTTLPINLARVRITPAACGVRTDTVAAGISLGPKEQSCLARSSSSSRSSRSSAPRRWRI